MTHEIEHGAYGLAKTLAQATPELLKEQRRAVRGTKHEQCIDLRDIDSFVKEIDGEQYINAARCVIAQCGTSFFLGAVSPDSSRFDARRIEDTRHEARVRHAHAEAQHTRLVDVAHSTQKLSEHKFRPDIVSGEHIREPVDVIATTPRPGNVTKIQSVMNPVINERAQPMLIDGIPEP